MKFADFYNYKTKLVVSCIDDQNDLHTCNINYGLIESFGRNVDGYKRFLPETSASLTSESTNGHYLDSATFDLHTITNTSKDILNTISFIQYILKTFIN
jgi:hypothetical protein